MLPLVIWLFYWPNIMKTRVSNQTPVRAEATRSLNQGALKLKAACQYLGGISPSSVRRLIDRKLLKPNRTLRHILIPIAELERFLREVQR
jgi:hypothetical protein